MTEKPKATDRVEVSEVIDKGDDFKKESAWTKAPKPVNPQYRKVSGVELPPGPVPEQEGFVDTLRSAVRFQSFWEQRGVDPKTRIVKLSPQSAVSIYANGRAVFVIESELKLSARPREVRQ